MHVIAAVTLPADVAPLVVRRLDGMDKPLKYFDREWNYPRDDADLDGTTLHIELTGHELELSFSTSCLSPTDQHTVRPALENRAATLATLTSAT